MTGRGMDTIATTHGHPRRQRRLATLLGLALVSGSLGAGALSLALFTDSQAVTGNAFATGTIDISMHRDDLSTRGKVTALEVTDLPIDLDGRPLILVDDVFFTGRTTRAALDAVASFGRPSKIQLAVLVDRGHRELPIRPDFVGKNLPTARDEKIRVRFENIDGAPDSVLVLKT